MLLFGQLRGDHLLDYPLLPRRVVGLGVVHHGCVASVRFRYLEVAWVLCSVVVAPIPIAMQVVCTSTMALGSRALAEKQAIVSRFASIAELAGMDMLCSCKTGKLTHNTMTMESKLPGSQISKQQLLLFALLATKWTQYAKGATGTLLFKCKNVVQADLDRHTSLDYTPFDPAVKATVSYVMRIRLLMRLSKWRRVHLTLSRPVVTIMRRSRRVWLSKCSRMLS